MVNTLNIIREKINKANRLHDAQIHHTSYRGVVYNPKEALPTERKEVEFLYRGKSYAKTVEVWYECYSNYRQHRLRYGTFHRSNLRGGLSSSSLGALVMLKVHFTWGTSDLPEYDAEKHNPEKVFAFLCYRGVHYAKWVTLDAFNINNWCLSNPRQKDK